MVLKARLGEGRGGGGVFTNMQVNAHAHATVWGWGVFATRDARAVRNIRWAWYRYIDARARF